MINLNYNNRHTFYISSGITLIILGLYPFYIAQDLSNISIKTWIFHSIPTLFSLFLIGYGLKLWNDKDSDYKELLKFKKEEIKVGNNLKMLEIEQRELSIKSIKGNMELEALENQIKEKKEAKKSIEEETKAKEWELKKLKDIADRQEKLLEEQRKILAERDKSISALPSQVFSISPTLSGTGSALPPFSYGSVYSYGYGTRQSHYCRSCKKPYTLNFLGWDSGQCSDCENKWAT